MSTTTGTTAPALVITGGASGIGLALARALLARGCRVVVADLDDSRLQAALASLEAPGRVHGVACDVTRAESVTQLWADAVDRLGGIDYWINNAGVGPPILRYDTVPRTWVDRAIDVNLRGAMYGTQVALAGMLAQGRGVIYNVVGFGYDNRKGDQLTVYGTTKAALRYFTESVARELKGLPVRVSWINPGFVLTPMTVEENRRVRERMGEDGWRKVRRLMNAVADEPPVAGEALAGRILRGEAPIDRLSPGVFLRRLAAAVLARPDPLGAHGL